MKFISKMSNLHIVLRPGIPAQPITGTPAQPALFVHFRDGVASVDKPELVELMLNHEEFGSTFIKVEDDEVDPYKSQRSGGEPVHVISEIENGRVKSREGKPVAPSPELQNAINEQAKALAMAMLPELLKAVQEKNAPTTNEETEETPATSETETKPKSKKK